jgi:hypothetical protein
MRLPRKAACSRSWWRTLLINEAKRMRQEDHEFEASLGVGGKKGSMQRRYDNR